MAKESWGISDVVTEISSKITAVRWKDNRIVYDSSTFTGNSFCQNILQETEQRRWYWAAKDYKYIQQINGGSWLHRPAYFSIYDQLRIKEGEVTFLDLR